MKFEAKTESGETVEIWYHLPEQGGIFISSAKIDGELQYQESANYHGDRIDDCLSVVLSALVLTKPEPSAEWGSVKDRPLITLDENGNWECTEDGDNDFIAAVHIQADEKNPPSWDTFHARMVDETGLCVVYGEDGDEDPCGWDIEAVSYWMPWPEPPQPGKEGEG